MRQSNKSIQAKAANIIKGDNYSSKPINFEDISVEIFIKFLFATVINNTKYYNLFHINIGVGQYRSTLKELFNVGKVEIQSELERDISNKFKFLFVGIQWRKVKNVGGW